MVVNSADRRRRSLNQMSWDYLLPAPSLSSCPAAGSLDVIPADRCVVAIEVWTRIARIVKCSERAEARLPAVDRVQQKRAPNVSRGVGRLKCAVYFRLRSS